MPEKRDTVKGCNLKIKKKTKIISKISDSMSSLLSKETIFTQKLEKLNSICWVMERGVWSQDVLSSTKRDPLSLSTDL